MTLEEELEVARKEVDAAVRKFAAIKGRQSDYDDAYVTDWAITAEYISPKLIRDEATVMVVIVPEDQGRATSRGLYEFGTDYFSNLRECSHG